MSLGYMAVAHNAAEGHLLLPLDDVYIHFQYAAQISSGHIYQYSSGDPATSGATSFLYPFLLAVGYSLGFTGLSLGYWALLIGGASLALSLVGVWSLLKHWQLSDLAALAGCSMLVLASPGWHFMSGMETGLFIVALLWTLASLERDKPAVFIFSAALAALLRPEGGALVLLAVLVACYRWFGRHWLPVLLLPLAALAVQPLVNLLVTGSAVATGNQSKSILSMIPHDWGVIMARIAQNFGQMWLEWLVGAGSGVVYLPPLGGLAGAVGLVLLLRSRASRPVALLIALWLLALALAVSTLDNAFWHFKRYQMPAIVVFIVLGAVTLQALWRWLRSAWARGLSIMLFAGALGFSGAQFLLAYGLNIGYVYAQPYAMAMWLNANTPSEVTVAVHDVGLMRYAGGRRTLDMVGLTTPGAAQHWRNGVGSVAEFLLSQQPDYIASYGQGHGYGLRLLESTPLLRDPLAVFYAEPDASLNVALAAPTQRIVKPDWQLASVTTRTQIHNSGVRYYLDQPTTQSRLVDFINVADIESEEEHSYRWEGAAAGYPTEVHELPVAGSVTSAVIVDGARRFTGTEEFTLTGFEPSENAVLVTRLHALSGGTLRVYADEVLVGERTIPHLPGQWVEFATLIPAELVRPQMTFRLVPDVAGSVYSPAMHWAYTQTAGMVPLVVRPEATVGNNWFVLADVVISAEATTIEALLTWDVLREQPGDYRLFAHLYANPEQPPVAQVDQYPMAGGLPAGNWLIGRLVDTISLPTDELPAGTYTLAIGFYDPESNLRLDMNSAVYRVLDNRLLIAQIAIRR
jgi:hypothetical protein